MTLRYLRVRVLVLVLLLLLPNRPNLFRIGFARNGGHFEYRKDLERLPARDAEGTRVIGLGDAAGAFRDVAADGRCDVSIGRIWVRVREPERVNSGACPKHPRPARGPPTRFFVTLGMTAL
jgi:hypothetical protein